MKPIVVIGEGGHSKVIQDIIAAGGEYEIIAVLDDKHKNTTRKNNIYYSYVSYSEQLIQQCNPEFVVAIGNNIVRQQIADRLLKAGATFALLIHPTAVISPTVQLSEGTVVMANSVINADAIIGKHVIINSSSVIEHDSIIEDYSHISPGVILTGSVHVEEGTHVGAGSVVIPEKRIGKWSIVGAGSVVVKDLPSRCTAVGMPAKQIKFYEE